MLNSAISIHVVIVWPTNKVPSGVVIASPLTTWNINMSRNLTLWWSEFEFWCHKGDCEGVWWCLRIVKQDLATKCFVKSSFPPSCLFWINNDFKKLTGNYKLLNCWRESLIQAILELILNCYSVMFEWVGFFFNPTDSWTRLSYFWTPW